MAIVDSTYANTYTGAERWAVPAAWSALDDTVKDKALIQAENQLTARGYSLDSSSDAHQKAIVEQAIFIVANPSSEKRGNLQSQGVKSAGIVQETYGDDVGIPICSYAKNVLSGGGNAGGFIGTANTIRDRDDETID